MQKTGALQSFARFCNSPFDLLSKILVWNGFYGSFEEFFRLQRTLILYPRNIPEFVMSEDILSLKEVSPYLGAATDFYPNKSCKSLNIMVPGAGD